MQHPIDTLYMDSEMLDDLASKDEFNYSRELVHKESESIMDYLERWLRQLFYNDTEYQFLKEYGEWIVGIVLFVVLVVAVFIYLKNHPELFDKRLKDGNLDYQVGVDSIYGVDFDAMLQLARNNGDYNEVVRLVYLQTLRLLNDKEIIKWKLYKTPTQYTREYSNKDFRDFTNMFLRVRYGGHVAKLEDVELMDSLKGRIVAAIGRDKQARAEVPASEVVKEPVSDVIEMEKGGREV
jgi:hypothetical protein